MRHTSLLWLFSVLVIAPAILFAESSTEMPAGLQAAYQQVQHQIEVIQEKGQPTRWRAVNPNNHLSVVFNGKGVSAQSLKDDWRLSMELTRLGEPNQLKAVNTPSVQIKDNRLIYDRGTIREWYINDPKGLEQGFTLDKPLAKEQLVLQFALGGDVKPTLIEKGKTLQLITPHGKKLRYEGLKAWDAKGRDLNATLQLKDKTLQLQVAVADAVYPITIDPWLMEDHKLRPDDLAPQANRYTGSVALSGDTALVSEKGSSYIFTHSGGTWSQQAKLVASDEGDNSVALSSDTALVVTPSNDPYVFIRSGSTWSQQAKLTASDEAAFDGVGISVALSGSGNTALVGTPFDDHGGSAYVFTRSGSTWSQQAKLIASDAALEDMFGDSVALSGNTALVGASGDNDGDRGYWDSGSAYVFTRSGGSWNQQAKLVASDPGMEEWFGTSVALSDNTALVGASGDDGDNVGVNHSGAAYVFTLTGSSWNQQAKLVASDAASEVWFGKSVALSGDTALVGGSSGLTADGGGPAHVGGSAYVFTRSGSTWSQQAKLIASDADSGDDFGTSVALSGDTALVSKRVNNRRGTAYTFDLSCNTTYTLPTGQWRQISLPCDPGANNTVAAVFGDDITEPYGTDAQWVLHRYDTVTNRYVSLQSTDPVAQGIGYWIIQITSTDKTLDMPNNSTPAPVTHPTGCLTTAKGCFEVPLATQNATPQWNMIGYPFKSNQKLADVRVLTKTETGICSIGCDLGTAESQGFIRNQLWTYSGSTYTLINTGDDLEPWAGYWATTLSSADITAPILLILKP